ncbi:hypothetical protein FRC00_001948, partial [Tulasnella sp. 408]
MPPRFRVLAGPSYDSLSVLPVNTDSTDSSTAFSIKTPHFEGRIVGNIKGFVDDAGEVVTSKYFEKEDRRKDGVTWSIQIQGRFLEPISANDVMFGNTFDRPLKLPWGTAAALQFAHSYGRPYKFATMGALAGDIDHATYNIYASSKELTSSI